MMASWLSQLLRPFRGSAKEGEPRDGPWRVFSPDGMLSADQGKFWNYWQMGYDPNDTSGLSAVVEACVSAYAQTIAQCPGDHWIRTDDGGRERVTTSALSRILRRPNDYQSRSDFILNLVRNLYLDGNTYALAERNSRFEVSALHPFDPLRCKPLIGPDEEIFYELGGNNVLDPTNGFSGYSSSLSLGTDPALLGSPAGRRVAPARDVLHVKLEAKRGEPLVGVAPIKHAGMAVAAQNAIGAQLINVFANMNRPAGVIETDAALTGPQVQDLRQRFNEAWRGVDNLAGGPPILTNGFKFHGISMTAKDSELASIAKLTWDEIFMVYGVPPAILGMTDRSAFASTEALMQFWLSRGLGFAINHIETAFDHFFGLRGYPDEWVEFDTSALLRVAYKDRIEALARGTISGIFSPDEARNSEDLPRTPYGDEPRVQQQVVPLSAWANPQPSTPGQPSPSSAAADDGTGDGTGDGTAPEKDWFAHLTEKVAEHDRQAAA